MINPADISLTVIRATGVIYPLEYIHVHGWILASHYILWYRRYIPLYQVVRPIYQVGSNRQAKALWNLGRLSLQLVMSVWVLCVVSTIGCDPNMEKQRNRFWNRFFYGMASISTIIFNRPGVDGAVLQTPPLLILN